MTEQVETHFSQPAEETVVSFETFSFCLGVLESALLFEPALKIGLNRALAGIPRDGCIFDIGSGPAISRRVISPNHRRRLVEIDIISELLSSRIITEDRWFTNQKPFNRLVSLDLRQRGLTWNANGITLPGIADKSLAAITCLDFCNILDIAELQSAFSRYAQVLQPDGRLVMLFRLPPNDRIIRVFPEEILGLNDHIMVLVDDHIFLGEAETNVDERDLFVQHHNTSKMKPDEYQRLCYIAISREGWRQFQVFALLEFITNPRYTSLPQDGLDILRNIINSPDSDTLSERMEETEKKRLVVLDISTLLRLWREQIGIEIFDHYIEVVGDYPHMISQMLQRANADFELESQLVRTSERLTTLHMRLKRCQMDLYQGDVQLPCRSLVSKDFGSLIPAAYQLTRTYPGIAVSISINGYDIIDLVHRQVLFPEAGENEVHPQSRQLRNIQVYSSLLAVVGRLPA
jgi:hypothetical protein